MNGCWVEPGIRDEVVAYVEKRAIQSGFSVGQLVTWTGISRGKYYEWKRRNGVENQHNGKIPRSNWLLPEEREAIIRYAQRKCLDYGVRGKDGYRRLTYMMLDENIVAVSPATTYRVLQTAGLLHQWNSRKPSSKGSGYKQPNRPHEEWHTDIKYVNFRGTYLFLISVLDGYSRYIVHHELRTNMTEYDVELTVQRAVEKYPKVNPRIISDNGSQYISKDFQTFLKEVGLQHIRTSIAYPQSNGKIERFHRSVQGEFLQHQSLIDLDDARQQFDRYVRYYNTQRLHSALYYLTPEDFLNGQVQIKLNIRQKKLNEAQKIRHNYWKQINNNIA